ALLSEPASLIQVWQLPRKERLLSELARCGHVAFHPDGRGCLWCPKGGGLRVWDLVKRRTLRELPLSIEPYEICVDSPGKRVAINNTKAPLVQILDVETGKELARCTGQVGLSSLSWSADDRLLASADDDGRVYVWDVAKGQLVSVLQGHTNKAIHCRF